MPPGDPVALADGLAGVLTEPMSVDSSRWGWDERVDDTVRVLREVVA